MLSVAIMAHPKRKHFVEELVPQLPDAEVVWDQKNDRWDTGRRAMMAYDPAATWHLVVQDDAILCPSFLAGVKGALDSVSPEVPVSFYTGRVRPYHEHVQRAVQGAKRNGLTWFCMRGPLWGPAVAVPVQLIERMVRESDPMDIPNYDMRMAEWFYGQGIQCWYSVPSLVTHRVGPENPSLVPGRGSGLGRVAFDFYEGDARTLQWISEAYQPGDPSLWWTEDHVCTRCWQPQGSLADAVRHAAALHGLGRVDLLASSFLHAQRLTALREELGDLVGTLYVVGPDISQRLGDVPHRRLRRATARNKIGRKGPFTIVGAARDFHYIGNRPGWSLVGGESN